MPKIQKMILKFVFSLLILILAQNLIIFNTNTVQAQNLWDMQEGLGADNQIGKEAFGQTNDPSDPRRIVARYIKIFLGFLGIIFVVLILWAGYKWMTAAGNEDKITEAKKQLQAAVIGLIIILMAYSVTKFVTCRMTEATTGVIQCLFN